MFSIIKKTQLYKTNKEKICNKKIKLLKIKYKYLFIIRLLIIKVYKI